MHRIPFAQLLSILLIVIMEIVIFVDGMDQEKNDPMENDHFQFKVIAYDRSTEEKDMGKAKQIRNTYLWRQMMEDWDCTVEEMNKLQRIGFEGSAEELVGLCEKWKKMARAADAFVAGDLSVKRPQFELVMVEEQFLLLTMSSAMEAIKAVYRDFFLWGKGNGLKVKVNFVNEKEFDVEELNKLNEKAQANEIFNKAVNASSNDLRKKMKDLEKGNIKCNIKVFWEVSLQLGLDWSTICKVSKDAEKKVIDEQKELDFLRKFFVEESDETENAEDEKEFVKVEETIGLLLKYYKNLDEEKLKKNPNKKKKQLPAMDPCEEAKLKVIKVDKDGQKSLGKKEKGGMTKTENKMRKTAKDGQKKVAETDKAGSSKLNLTKKGTDGKSKE